jgi:hypothetical protein
VDCKDFDEQVVRLDKPIRELAPEFVLVRLTRITGMDLNVFDFDYDLTWMAFFLSPDEKVYGRYGGRDAASAERRLSPAGLHHAMQAALEAHRRGDTGAPAKKVPPLLGESYPGTQRMHVRGECVHCHQINEARREALQAAGRWTRADVWVYPLPENVGLTLDVDEGNRVRSVTHGSAADRAGLRAGDLLRRLNGFPVASFADAQHALHRAPAQGPIGVFWERDGRTQTGTLDLTPGWRKTNLTWRPSLLDLLPALALAGENLTAAEKKALGLGAKRLAFRQLKPVHKSIHAAGVREGDVIIGIDHQFPEMSMDDFLGYVRRTHLVGDRVLLHVLRGGKQIDLPMTLR